MFDDPYYITESCTNCSLYYKSVFTQFEGTALDVLNIINYPYITICPYCNSIFYRNKP